MISIKALIDILILLMVVLPYTKYAPISFIIFLFFIFVVSIYNLSANSFKVCTKMLVIPILLIILFIISIILELLQLDRNFINSSLDIIKRTVLILGTIWIISSVKVKYINRFLITLMRNAFILGVILLAVSVLTGNYIVNENVAAFLLLPYLGYQIFRNKRLSIKLILFIIGIITLYLTNGRTSLLAFGLTPLFLLFINRQILKVFLIIIFTIGVTSIQIFFKGKLMFLDTILSGRIVIQEAYIEAILEKDSILLFGSGNFILGEHLFLGLGPHQTWLGLLWTYGIIGVLINLLFVLYSFMFKVPKEFLYLDLMILYISIIQLFESVNVGGISYISFMLLIVILLKVRISIQNQKI